MKEKLKKFVLYWWRTEAHLNHDFDMLLGKTRGSWKGWERMSAGKRQECWRGAAEPRRVWANSTEEEGWWEGDLGTPPGRGRRKNTGTLSAGNSEVGKAKFPSSLK